MPMVYLISAKNSSAPSKDEDRSISATNIKKISKKHNKAADDRFLNRLMQKYLAKMQKKRTFENGTPPIGKGSGKIERNRMRSNCAMVSQIALIIPVMRASAGAMAQESSGFELPPISVTCPLPPFIPSVLMRVVSPAEAV